MPGTPNSTLLAPTFHDVAQFAGIEVFLRGVGDKQQYNYTMHDVHCVSTVFHRDSHPDEAALKRLTNSPTAIELLRAYTRHLRIREGSCPKCGHGLFMRRCLNKSCASYNIKFVTHLKDLSNANKT